MPFLRENIDRAIVMTQYDLRGFGHPLGFRIDMPSAKYLDAVTCNFASFAAGGSAEYTVENFPDFFDFTYDEYLSMCRQLYSDCECSSQKEAIQLIFAEIRRQGELIKEEEQAGTREKSKYTQELTKDTRWGRAVLAMLEVFGSPDKKKVAA